MQKRRASKISKHPFVVPVVTFMVLFFTSMVAFIAVNAQTIAASDSHVVEFSIDGVKQTLPTRASTVGELLKRLNITLNKFDILEPPKSTPIFKDNFKINLYRARPVTVVDGGHKVSFLSALATPRLVAQKAGIKLFQEDNVVLASPDEILSEGIVGQKIVVTHATPIKLNLYGKTLSIRTHAKTVQELLDERKISGKDISVFPALKTRLKNNSVVFVTDPGQEIKLVEQDIPYSQTYVDDYNLEEGATAVRTPGKLGKKVIVYAAPKGKPELRKILQEVLVYNPIKEVIARGRKLQTNQFSGGFDAALALLRSCEGSYSSNTGNGYYGAYQFDIGTWGNYGGYPNAAAAPPIVQDQKARDTYVARGWSPWPTCSVNLGLQDKYR